jgi:hypothetical protein
MKILNKTFYFFALFVALGLLTACPKKSTTPKTLLEILSKNWKVSRVLINGQVDNAGNYTNFRLLLQQNGTYAVTVGEAPASVVINPSNNGKWEISSGETQIVFDKGTSNEFAVTLVEKTENKLTIRFKIPPSINKTEPEYTFEFVPAT